jgi:hypothetical protein
LLVDVDAPPDPRGCDVSTEIKMRTRAFLGVLATHRVRVDKGGEVRVWDPVAGYFTSCHSMSEREMSRARKLAGAK